MTTQNTITITSPDETPLLFTQAEELLIEGIRGDLTGWAQWANGDITRSELEVEITGESKWEGEFTSMLEVLGVGRVIMWVEVWDDEDGGSRTRTFINGQLVSNAERVMVMMPDDYLTLVAAVREALIGNPESTEPELFDAATALVNAIDPVTE